MRAPEFFFFFWEHLSNPYPFFHIQQGFSLNVRLFYLHKWTEQKWRDPKDSFLLRLVLTGSGKGDNFYLCFFFLPQRDLSKMADLMHILKSIPVRYSINQSLRMCWKEKKGEKPFASVPPTEPAAPSWNSHTSHPPSFPRECPSPLRGRTQIDPENLVPSH